MDLSVALHCIETMKSYNTYRGEKIGIVREDLKILGGYRAGEIILYREEVNPLDCQMAMGEYMGMEQKPTGKLTIERPIDKEWIEANKQEGSLLTTHSTCIGVPCFLVEEIVM